MGTSNTRRFVAAVAVTIAAVAATACGNIGNKSGIGGQGDAKFKVPTVQEITEPAAGAPEDDVFDPELTIGRIGTHTVEITVQNSTSVRSDYMIRVVIESPDGQLRYDSVLALIYGLDPGQIAFEEAMFYYDMLPPGAVPRISEVQRSPT